MAKGGRGGRRGGGTRMIHVTTKDAADGIEKNGFDISNAGKGAGSTWGDAIYFSQNEMVNQFYTGRMGSKAAIEATVDTKGFLEVDFGSEIASSTGKMYDHAAKSFTQTEQKQYSKLKRDYKKTEIDYSGKAFKEIASKYPGIVIRQSTKAIDPLTGGDQVVVFKKSRITKIKRTTVK